MLPVNSSFSSDGKFCFLNQSASFGVDDVDWRAENMPRLWQYNLHYFDYLRDESLRDSEKIGLITSWIEANAQSSRPGWEPFTTSLRIVNWIGFLANTAHPVDAQVLRSLYTQTLWLERNDERHILANHYFENLKALFFAGLYFSGTDAQRWREAALKKLLEQLAEQTLDDGGHFERSCQYHSLMLENYLDILNLLLEHKDRCNFNNEHIDPFRLAVISGLDFLHDVLFPGSRIPLFNDAAYGIAPDPEALCNYANRLFDYRRPEEPDEVKLIEKHSSGLYGFRSAGNMLLMDSGDVGPDYQPGHTHCDFLSYELFVGGLPLVVDTGVCEYEPGDRRHYLRSTAAHNTVSVDGREQSEIWGAFRVSRRARKIAGRVSAKPAARDAELVIEGAFRGFFFNPMLDRPAVTHNRKIYVKLDKGAISRIDVVDTIDCTNKEQSRGKSIQYEFRSFVHFHPDVVCSDRGSGKVALIHADGSELELWIPQPQQYQLIQSIYCPEFGSVEETSAIEIVMTGAFPQEMRYSMVAVTLN